VRHARFTKRARAELLAQVSYSEEQRDGRGAGFLAAVEAAAAARAAAHPQHEKLSAAGTRRRLVAAFPFSVVYTEIEDGILIHAVADGGRLPEYWLGRLPRGGA
jgi:hypothetical protein